MKIEQDDFTVEILLILEHDSFETKFIPRLKNDTDFVMDKQNVTTIVITRYSRQVISQCLKFYLKIIFFSYFRMSHPQIDMIMCMIYVIIMPVCEIEYESKEMLKLSD